MNTPSPRPTRTSMVRHVVVAGIAVVLLGGTVAFLSTFTRQEVLLLALPTMGDAPSPWSRPLARRLVKSWRSCPPLLVEPETAVGFVVNAMTTEAGRRHADEARALIVDLLQAGCGIDEYNRFGKTPLMNAILYGDAQAVQMLLDLGADPRLRLRPDGAAKSPTPFAKSVEGLTCTEFAERLLARLTERGLPTDGAQAVLERLRSRERPPG